MAIDQTNVKVGPILHKRLTKLKDQLIAERGREVTLAEVIEMALNEAGR